jgi:two-component system chemotaxis sensor kinase CheA
VDDLLDLAAEMTISHGELARLQARVRGSLRASEAALLEQVLARLGRAAAESRHRLLRVRLAPISTMFRRYTRYLRDLSRERGQVIDLVITGGDTVVDRTIIGRLFEPLVHMVRNAVAHGIESPGDRLAAGKPANPRILLGARLVDGRVRITVADDGRGLALEAIKRKARAWGLQPDTMAEAELRRLIFQPGFSTAKELSTLAGRGVGLDVVASLVQSLGGGIDVRSVAGQGTVFLIDLPVTTSLFKALLFLVGGELYAIPAGFVRDSQRMQEGSWRREHQGWAWRGEELRVLDAGDLLGCSTPEQARARRYGIIVDLAGKRCVLMVDGLSGVQEIVVKPLDETLGDNRLVAGTAVLGQGRVVPVLECGEILRRTEAACPVMPSFEGEQGGAYVQ